MNVYVLKEIKFELTFVINIYRKKTQRDTKTYKGTMDVVVNHYNNLPEEDREILEHYTHEIDCDDWSTTPLLLSYEVINFILKQRYMPRHRLGYTPELIRDKVLSQEDLQKQVANAKHMREIISKFPSLPHDIIVYRGFLNKDVFFSKSTFLFEGDDITVPYFLSTSLNFDSASKFTNRNSQKCYWKIVIPKGFPVALLKSTIESVNAGMEDEVLLNIGAILQCVENTFFDNHCQMITFVLKGYSKIAATRGYWETIQEIASDLL
jgi:hypothetical protein